MSPTKPSHFAVIPIAGWGHVRPILHLSVNLITAHPNLHLTFLLAPSVRGKALSELNSTSFKHLHEQGKDGKIIDRIQVINVSADALKGGDGWDVKNMAVEAMDYATALPKFLEPLFIVEKQVKEIPNKFKDIPVRFVIYDLFQSFAPSLLAGLTAANNIPMVPMIAFCPSNAIAMYHHLAKKENGGFLELYLDLQQKEIEKGLDPLEAIGKVMYQSDGTLKTLPGLPPMYDYEFGPMWGSLPPMPQAFLQICSMRTAALDPSTTALVMPCVEEVEPEAVKALRDELGIPILMAGLQFPTGVWNGEKPVRSTEGDAGRVVSFLDDMESKHGKRSVAYISFGSIFWPLLRPEVFHYLLESLSDHKIPFVFAYASPMASIPDDLMAKLDANGEACVVKIAPQWEVLEHDALKFFVSHCGSNSIAEAIMSEVPIVAFPFGADQAEFSALMVTTYKVAIELTQVKTLRDRTLPKKLYGRPDIIGTEEAIKSEMSEVWGRIDTEGTKMRENMVKLKEICKASWESGAGRKVMVEDFAQYF